MNDILKKLGMNYKEFSTHYEIPYNTVRQWAQGTRKPPKYIIKLLNEKIERESKGEQMELQYDCINEYQQGEEAMQWYYESIIIPQKIEEMKKNFAKKLKEASQNDYIVSYGEFIQKTEEIFKEITKNI